MKFRTILLTLLLGALVCAPVLAATPGFGPGELALQVANPPAAPSTEVAAPAAPAPAAEPAAAPAKGETAPPSTDELVNAGKKVYTDWTTLGWMAGVSALCGFLLLLLRYKRLDDLLTNKDWKKWKPWVSAFIGAVGGFFGYLILPDMTWANWPQAIASGLMAGFAMVGVHQGFGGAGSGKEPPK